MRIRINNTSSTGVSETFYAGRLAVRLAVRLARRLARRLAVSDGWLGGWPGHAACRAMWLVGRLAGQPAGPAKVTSHRITSMLVTAWWASNTF